MFDEGFPNKFSLFIIIINNIISYTGGQLDGPVAFLAACPYIIYYIIFICYFIYFWEIKMLACRSMINRGCYDSNAATSTDSLL